MLGRYRRLPRINADRSWLGNTPCGLFVFMGLARLSGSGQKMRDWAVAAVLQKLLGRNAVGVKAGIGEGA